MIFKLDHHNQILVILNSLNANLLQKNSTFFGGGTLIALLYNEYRQSNDIDLICPLTSPGYKNLRTVIFDGGYQALFSDLNSISLGRGTMDQYGIRLLIKVNDTLIKTEIIAESRFQAAPPRYLKWSKIPCLSHLDCFTTKLLANSDRYMDDSVQSRDLIDLAVLRLNSPIPKEAIRKAEQAYEVIRPLTVAVKRFQERPEYREKCFIGLKIDNQQIPRIIDGIDWLASDLDLTNTERTFQEQPDLFN